MAEYFRRSPAMSTSSPVSVVRTRGGVRMPRAAMEAARPSRSRSGRRALSGLSRTVLGSTWRSSQPSGPGGCGASSGL